MIESIRRLFKYAGAGGIICLFRGHVSKAPVNCLRCKRAYLHLPADLTQSEVAGLHLLSNFFAIDWAMWEQEPARWQQLIGRRLYKYTDCGAWIDVDWRLKQIRLGSIVEGCDFGTLIYCLPFNHIDNHSLEGRIAKIEEEANLLWHWANDEEARDCEDPPCFEPQFSIYETDGRSS